MVVLTINMSDYWNNNVNVNVRSTCVSSTAYSVHYICVCKH
jgi:hypothetical protein